MFPPQLLVGLIAGPFVTATVAVAASAGEGTHQGLKESPLARIISGNLGRMMVLRSELDLRPAASADSDHCEWPSAGNP